MSSFPHFSDPKTPFAIDQTITRARAGFAYQDGLIGKSKQVQYNLTRNSQAITNAQTLVNQTWRTASLHFASLVATINDLIR